VPSIHEAIDWYLAMEWSAALLADPEAPSSKVHLRLDDRRLPEYDERIDDSEEIRWRVGAVVDFRYIHHRQCLLHEHGRTYSVREEFLGKTKAEILNYQWPKLESELSILAADFAKHRLANPENDGIWGE
jgi:hypothetical protein